MRRISSLPWVRKQVVLPPNILLTVPLYSSERICAWVNSLVSHAQSVGCGCDRGLWGRTERRGCITQNRPSWPPAGITSSSIRPRFLCEAYTRLAQTNEVVSTLLHSAGNWHLKLQHRKVEFGTFWRSTGDCDHFPCVVGFRTFQVCLRIDTVGVSVGVLPDASDGVLVGVVRWLVYWLVCSCVSGGARLSRNRQQWTDSMVAVVSTQILWILC